MEDIIATVDKTIEEHKSVLHCALDSQTIAEDVCASMWLSEAREQMTPGRLGGQRAAMERLQESLVTLQAGLEEHFQREERALLGAFERQTNKAMAGALAALLGEHQELRQRIATLRKDVAELLSEQTSLEVWQAKAWGIRAYMRHTANLLEAHASSEEELLTRAREQLGGGGG